MPPVHDIVNASIPVVAEELGHQLDILEKEGRQYAEALMVHHLCTPRRRIPERPLGMHPGVASAIREIALDEAVAIRLYGPRHGFQPGASRQAVA